MKFIIHYIGTVEWRIGISNLDKSMDPGFKNTKNIWFKNSLENIIS